MATVLAGPRPLPKARRAGLDITEKQWQAQVIQLATLCGWRHQHQHDSRRSVPGWPDLVLCRPPRLLAVELKSRSGKVTPEQQTWLDDLAACGVETHIWRPADLDRARTVLARRHLP
jgi:VRR-NUC domain